MDEPVKLDKQHASRGIVLMVVAMAAFAIADMFIKMAAGTMSSAHTALILTAGSLPIFVLIAKLQGERLISRQAIGNVLLIRYVAEIIATFGMVQALRLVPLSTVGAILQATPLMVVLGAVVLLGEQVSWRRWSAIGVGFVGVLHIVQPGAQDFDANVLWAVLAMLGLSARDLTTRVTPAGMASSRLAAYTMMAAMPFALFWVLLTEPALLPTNPKGLLVMGMIAFATTGYLLITSSIRTAPVSVVSPYRYTRLLFLLLLGVIVFNEQPDAMMLSGAVLIIVSGLYTMWRERRVKGLR